MINLHSSIQSFIISIKVQGFSDIRGKLSTVKRVVKVKMKSVHWQKQTVFRENFGDVMV